MFIKFTENCGADTDEHDELLHQINSNTEKDLRKMECCYRKHYFWIN